MKILINIISVSLVFVIDLVRVVRALMQLKKKGKIMSEENNTPVMCKFVLDVNTPSDNSDYFRRQTIKSAVEDFVVVCAGVHAAAEETGVVHGLYVCRESGEELVLTSDCESLKPVIKLYRSFASKIAKCIENITTEIN